ncbi:unnamed protein product [Paramecium pentaurelia]|uniref:ADP-ribosylation factor n=1 Tax=Paramecium pentaurelia TaxID=43138 RepID=A0A8S1X9S0_9CILI|nr:unnamed protein product [Paramecium pentaurelia]
MGNPFSQFKSSQKPVYIMIGMDAAGKTTILYKLKLGKIENLIPTIGLNLETIQSKNFDIISWDIGGADKQRILCKPYLKNSKGIIYTFDCSDKERKAEAIFELHQMLLDPLLFGQPLLIYSNKQDLVKMNSEELAVELKIEKFSKNWHIQPCCAITGEGLQEGLKWIEEQLKLK